MPPMAEARATPLNTSERSGEGGCETSHSATSTLSMISTATST